MFPYRPDISSYVIKTFPDPPDSWNNSLTPAEANWYIAQPATGAALTLDSGGIRLDNTNADNTYQSYIGLKIHNGLWFDATKQSAQLHYDVLANTGSNYLTGHEDYVYLLDASGRQAWIDLGSFPVGVWKHVDLNFDPSLWNVSSGFDWHYIQEVWIARSGWLRNYMWVKTVYFSYYQYVPPLLTVTSQTLNGQNISEQFRFDSTIEQTPYSFSPQATVATTIWMEPTNFVYWLDDHTNTSPTRDITLAEAQEFTATAVYSQAPPPPASSYLAPLLVIGGISVVGLLWVLTRKSHPKINK